MSKEEFEVILPSSFEQIDEWASGKGSPSDDLTNGCPPEHFVFLSMIQSILIMLNGRCNPIGSWVTSDMPSSFIDIDISREMRWLGFSESEIKRWELVKKIERETGKRCDDYV